MLPPAIATTSNIPRPLRTPPLACIMRVMARMSTITCTRTCKPKAGRRQRMAKLLAMLNARYRIAVTMNRLG